MNKKWLPIAEGVAIVALIIGLFAKGNTSQQQITQKESEIQEIQTQLEEKDSELAAMTDIAADYETLQNEKVTLESEKTVLESEKTVLESEKTVLESENAVLESEKTELADQLSAEVVEETEEETDDVEAVTENAEAEEDSDETKQLVAEKESELAEKDSLIAEKDTQLAEKDSLLAEKDTQLAEKDQEFEEKEAQYQKQAAELQEELEKILGVRGEIITDLTKAFEDTDLAVSVDEETGIISLDTNVLFGFDSSDLTKEGMALLEEFIPKYFDVVFSDDVKDYVSEVIVEGHTDDVGTYLYNLYMSQKRAYSVAKYCLDEQNELLSAEEIEELSKILTANGKSFSNPVLDEKGEIDDAASRRVEVKFRMISDELLNEKK